MTDQPTPRPDPPDSTADVAKQQAGAIAETGKEQAGQVVDEAKAQTSQLLGEARTQARDRADTQVTQLAGVLEQMSGELDRMADGSSQAESGYMTALARDGSKTARSLAKRLDDGGLDGALDDVRRFARKRPGAFLAGAFGVGLLLGRVTRNADLGEITSGSNAQSSNDPSGTSQRPSRGGRAEEMPAAGDDRVGGVDTVPPASGSAPQPMVPGEPDLVSPRPDAGGATRQSTRRQP